MVMAVVVPRLGVAAPYADTIPDPLVAVAPPGAPYADTIPPPSASALMRRGEARTPEWRRDLLQLLQRVETQELTPSRLPSLTEINGLLDAALPRFDIDPDALPEAIRWQLCQRIYNYAALYRRDIQATLLRADVYLPMIKRTLKRGGLPVYYGYIPLVESAFRTDARHPVSGARGLWQFMAATARTHGLEVSSSRDERLQPERATRAVAGYLKRLLKRFGAQAPLVVLAAYNFGETNVSKAMKREATRDIWRLYLRRRIPSETREYLLRMLAMWVISAHPGRFHFLLAEAVETPPPTWQRLPGHDAVVDLAFTVGEAGE